MAQQGGGVCSHGREREKRPGALGEAAASACRVALGLGSVVAMWMREGQSDRGCGCLGVERAAQICRDSPVTPCLSPTIPSSPQSPLRAVLQIKKHYNDRDLLEAAQYGMMPTRGASHSLTKLARLAYFFPTSFHDIEARSINDVKPLTARELSL